MRIWSIHPNYLDAKGLVAVWREGLLALHVLSGKTVGYTNHPQLQRFKEHSSPVDAITDYLHSIADEADRRGYTFDRQKLMPYKNAHKIAVTRGQLEFETKHLKAKLRVRDDQKYIAIKELSLLSLHPLFELTEGSIAIWEKSAHSK